MNGKVFLFTSLSAILLVGTLALIASGNFGWALYTGAVAALDLYVAFKSFNEQPKSN